MYDAIVIGAGPAGLQAALTLGRMHRTALLLDSGEYRNGTVEHMHNIIASDGTPPAEFRATARAQLAEYSALEARDARVERIEGVVDDFTVELEDGSTVRGRRIVLATGVADDLPGVPGLAGLWGLRAFTCPFCDGHEFAGRDIGILGATARTVHLVAMLSPIVRSITVFALDEQPTDEDRAALEAAGADIHSGLVRSVAAEADGARVTTTAAHVAVAGLFVAAGTVRQRASFAADRGLRMLPSGAIEIDDFGQTSEPGILAAGDLAHRPSLPGPVASVIQAAAAGQMAAARIVQEFASS
ncbi:NAD(P)/FAD-dependent oxidoreductase [Microbacterium sp.]|uniref:NAD(P)/FAD-dependent oxidoreductase n=1 Tax=Microbacterium sp. TaxID=51671 RepID=UPI002B76277B|nr:NAD(P)/FAD-dependent oxidoreductase [Microbacterium sp.]HWK76425.1 NAD(P)/FAD-dependent oxidoreductase [Microbacterium sp.]